MHPKQICADFASMGAPIVLDGDDLYIENPENIYPELEELAKSYKARIIAYLKNDYSDDEHKVFQTIDKIMSFYVGRQQDMNEKINDWLNYDDEALKMIMKLMVMLHANGWHNVREPIGNYETDETFEVSLKIYERAMNYFKKGARK